MTATGAPPGGSEGWVPAACTLPTLEQPLRVAEFDSLFAAALLAVHRVDDTTLSLLLQPAPGLGNAVRELTARESQCCSFFTFTITGGDPLRLQVSVPPAHAPVLDGLAERARRAAAASGESCSDR